MAREPDLVPVGREFAGVGDAKLVTLEIQQLDEGHCAALDLAVLQFGFALPLPASELALPASFEPSSWKVNV